MLESIFGTVFVLAILAASLFITYWLFVIVADMAKARGQSRTLWWFISLIITPITAMIVLWLFFERTEDAPPPVRFTPPAP
ncbi:hypothetical protein [Celeribacter arenosi]|uniref:Phospholipase_D-nuclease N-terminal n=1 Tax=Celeribacter arenosi TaxID=792649 RepID=A0ABP7JYA1_9RHOB